MELNITQFFNEAVPSDYSASAMELGQNAGAITWAAAKADALDYDLLDTEEKREAFREYAAGFGAWDQDEIAQWSDNDLNALLIQFISGDMREVVSPGEDWDWGEYERGCEDGGYNGGIFRSDDGQVYFYIGS